MSIAVIDCGIGNIGSVVNMFKKAGAEAFAVQSPDEILHHHAIVLPGVGSFDRCMNLLNSSGFAAKIPEALEKGQYLLGICAGLQMLFEGSEEGAAQGLGLLKGRVRKFCFAATSNLKVPHMGWNTVMPQNTPEILSGYSDEIRFYFANSYYVDPAQPEVTVGRTEYGHTFASVVQHGRVYGVQFHPEKSHVFGLQLFKNFLAITHGAP